MQIIEHASLHHLNTFHVSAGARWLTVVRDDAELKQALAWAREKAVPFLLIGQGSNILFKEDFPGLVIELHMLGRGVRDETDTHVDVRAMAGEIWHDFVLHCLAQNWYGLENLSLIPGTVGAAPVQNIGAYGVELGDVLLELEAMEIATGASRVFSNAMCRFSYRSSVFKEELQGQYVITSATFRLRKKAELNLDYPALQQALKGIPPESLTPRLVSETVCAIRSSKLPDPALLGNAGSFFWNPRVGPERYNALRERWPGMPGYPERGLVKIPAAWLIEQAGWKGYREGDIGVHAEHALVLVNYGRASGADLVGLSERIQASVRELFNIELQPEVRII